jgi:hypothetical protein
MFMGREDRKDRVLFVLHIRQHPTFLFSQHINIDVLKSILLNSDTTQIRIALIRETQLETNVYTNGSVAYIL